MCQPFGEDYDKYYYYISCNMSFYIDQHSKERKTLLLMQWTF